jgi:hypothetical protein
LVLARAVSQELDKISSRRSTLVVFGGPPSAFSNDTVYGAGVAKSVSEDIPLITLEMTSELLLRTMFKRDRIYVRPAFVGRTDFKDDIVSSEELAAELASKSMYRLVLLADGTPVMEAHYDEGAGLLARPLEANHNRRLTALEAYVILHDEYGMVDGHLFPVPYLESSRDIFVWEGRENGTVGELLVSLLRLRDRIRECEAVYQVVYMHDLVSMDIGFPTVNWDAENANSWTVAGEVTYGAKPNFHRDVERLDIDELRRILNGVE